MNERDDPPPAEQTTARTPGPSLHRPTSAPLRQLGLLLAVMVLLGLPVRLFIAQRAVMVSRDTVTFIWYAQALEANPVEAMKQHDQHPLYPAMVLGAHHLLKRSPLPDSVRNDPVRSWTIPAIAVTLAGGLAVVAAVYLLTSALFNPTIGLIAAVLAAAAAEFCQLSADGLTDMPHLAVYLTAVWAATRGLQSGRWVWFALVGLLAGMGYLLRPEGASPAVVTAGLLVTPWACRMAWRKRAAALVCVMLASAAVAGPYMLATGKLVQKKSLWRFFETGEPATANMLDRTGDTARCERQEPGSAAARRPCQTGGEAGSRWAAVGCTQAGAGDVPRAFLPIAENWVRSLRGTYLLPLVAWLVLRKRYPCERSGLRVVQAAAGLHLVILLGLIVRFDYWNLFSLRHVLVLSGLTFPFAAAGVIALVESLPERIAGWAALLLGLGLIVPTLPWMFEVRHGEETHYVSAARWMRENTPYRPRVMTERFRMAFYAQGDYIPAPLTADVADYLARARRDKPDWIAFDERRILKESRTFFADLESSLVPGENLELARIEKRTTDRGVRRVLVYHYTPPG